MTVTMTLTFSGDQSAPSLSFGGVTYDVVSLSGGMIYENHDGITSIADEAFISGADELVAVNIPTTVTSIGTSAFFGSSNLVGLTSVTFDPSSGLQTIGDNAFRGCGFTSFSFANLPNLTSLGIGAFRFCGLYTLAIPNTLTSWSSNAFDSNASLTTVTFDSGCQLTSIPPHAFSNCTLLNGITIPHSITLIMTDAFAFDTHLHSITIPNSITIISDQVFSNCIALTTVIFESTPVITTIGLKTFYFCTSLSSFTLPASVLTIGDMAFFSCSSLTSFPIATPSSLLSIGDQAFDSFAGSSFVIPNSITSLGSQVFSNTNMTWIENSSPAITFNGTDLLPASFDDSSHILYTDSTHPPSVPPTTMYDYISTNYPHATIIIGPSCYNEDTQILTDIGYKNITKIAKDDLIKTLNDGYKKVIKIHFQPFTANNKHKGTSMYRFKPKNDKDSVDVNGNPVKFDSLTITGNHCILVNNKPNYMEDYVKKGKEDEWTIDGKYISLSQANPNFTLLEDGKHYIVYHLVLENDDKNRRYAIYANGLLSESMSEGHYDSIRNPQK